MQISPGNFNIVAKNLVKAHLKGLYPCPPPFLSLELSDPLLTPSSQPPQFVDFIAVAVSYQTAFAEGPRGVRVKG